MHHDSRRVIAVTMPDGRVVKRLATVATPSRVPAKAHVDSTHTGRVTVICRDPQRRPKRHPNG